MRSMQTQDNQDPAAFAARALALLGEEPAPAALEARILADFDRVAARPSLLTRFVRLLEDTSEVVWPGAPVWQPASVLALALAAGLAAGLMVPSTALARDTSDSIQTASLDSVPQLDLSGGEL
jgi:hypothetical protein